MNFEMKHNGSRIYGTTGPSQSTNLHHLNHLNQNQFLTKSVHHLNNLNSFNNLNNNYSSTNNHQSNSSYLHKNHHLNNYPHHYLPPNTNYYYHHPYPLDSKGLYRINSALNLDHLEFETNLKREFGSIGALNNYSHQHNSFNTNQIYPASNHSSTLQQTNQDHLLSFYSILKEFKRQNLDHNHSTNNRTFATNSSSKIQDYLRARNEMSNCDLVNNNANNLIKNNYDKKHYSNFTVDGAFNKLNNNHHHHYLTTNSSIYHQTNELNNSLSAYHSNCKLTNNPNTALIGSNLALNDCVQASPRSKKRIYKIWEIKSDKSAKNKLNAKMSGDSSQNNKNEGSSTVDGSSTRAIFKKFTRIGSSKNVSSNSNNTTEQSTIHEEYRSINQAVSTTHLDDPEVRFEEKLRKKAFAHYDCQSLTANLSYASRLCHILSKRRNTTTGASAASMISKQQNLNTVDLENNDIDNGDDRSNDLLLSCPYFRNELGGEGERMISLNRITYDQQSTSNNKSNKTIFIHKPNMTSGLALLEDANERRWKIKCCPYQKLNSINTPHLEHLFLIENNDVGATYYRNNFYGLEHQNWFGIDENLGPIAISIRRERVPIENCLIKKNSNEGSSSNVNNSLLSAAITSVSQQQPQPQTKNQYRLIIRTSELNVLRGTVFEDCVPGLNLKNNNHNNHHAKEILDYIAPEINLNCLRLGVSNADEQLLRLDEQAQTGKYKVGVLYCKSGQSTEEEMYNNEFAGTAFEDFLTCLGQRVRLKGFEKYRAGLDNKKDTTGLHSIYATFADCEIMFHVSTLLPYTTDRQQILRKQHIGNDIVTIVFQEQDACQFTPKLIRSHFQHVFIIVKVLPSSSNGLPKYSVAISRSKDVPVFGPPIPENGIFTKSKQFTDFLLSKIINAENAAHRSEKFRSMAQRTRHEYLKELAQKFITSTSINDLTGSSAGSKLVNSIFGGSKKSRSNRAGRDSHFIGDAVIKGAICWEMFVEDFGQSKVIDCLVAISSDSLVVIEESTKESIFVCPNVSILGWSSHPNYIKIFYHQGECILLKCKDPDLDEINEIVNRLKNVTNGCETQEIILKRNNAGQLGFHVGFDGIITHVDIYTYAWQAGLRRYARIVEICKVAIATLSYEQMQDLLKTSLTVSITTLPPLNEHQPRRGCNLQTCTYVTNPMAFTNQNSGGNGGGGGNYENINNVFDRFARNQQFQQLNGQTNKGYLNQQATTGSLNYQQTNSNNQSTNSGHSHQLGLPTTTMQSRTNCSSPASNSSITTSKSSPTTGIGLLNSSGLSRSKTMLDSSTSSSKKSTLLCSMPSTPTSISGQIAFKQPQVLIHNKITGATSIASSIQDSLNQLSLSTTSSQTNAVNLLQPIECSDLGLPTEPIKINLSTSKQTSDYNSDTSSSNEFNSNTWGLSSNKLNCTDLENSKFVCPKVVNKSSKFKTPFAQPAILNNAANKNDKSITPTNIQSSESSSLLRNTYNSIKQQALNNSTNKNNSVSNQQQTNSTLQEDLLRLINPDSYLSDNADKFDNLSEVNSNSSNPLSNESSNTQYSTPYSSLERSNTSCSNKEFQSTNEDRKMDGEETTTSSMITVAQPAQVISNDLSMRNQQTKFRPEKPNRSSSMEFLCKIDNQLKDDKKSQSATKTKKYSFDSNSTAGTADPDWPSLVNNANKALAVTQQASQNNLPTTTNFASNKKLFKNEFQPSDSKTSPIEDPNTCPSPATQAAVTLNQHRNSLDEWIKEFENFSKNAGTLFGGDGSKRFSISNNPDQSDDCFQLEPSQLDEEKVKSLEDRLKQLQSDLVKEQSSKMSLEDKVKYLEEENRRLHNESVTEMCFKFCFGSSTKRTSSQDSYSKRFSEAELSVEVSHKSRKKSSRRFAAEEKTLEQQIETKKKRRAKRSKERKKSPRPKITEEQVSEQILCQIKKHKSKHPSQLSQSIKKDEQTERKKRRHIYTSNIAKEDNEEIRKRRSRSPRIRQTYDFDSFNLMEMYNKQIPLPYDPFTYDRYVPQTNKQEITFVQTPEVAEQTAPDNNSASIKMDEKGSGTDLENFSDTEKSTKLSRQIPIIKIVGDLEEASTLNLNDVPTYKSDSLYDVKTKAIDKEKEKELYKKLKKNMNLLNEIGLMRSSRTKTNIIEGKTDSVKEGKKTASILSKNLAFIKENSLPKKGPRLIKAPSKIKMPKKIPSLKETVSSKTISSSSFSKDSSPDKVNGLDLKSEPDINSASSLGKNHGSNQSTARDEAFFLESKSNFTKSDTSVASKLASINSRSSATSERFNVTSKTQRVGTASSLSIGKVNPFTSLSKFIKKEFKETDKKSLKSKKTSSKNSQELKMKQNQLTKKSDNDSSDQGSLLSVTVNSSDKVLNKISNKISNKILNKISSKS